MNLTIKDGFDASKVIMYTAIAFGLTKLFQKYLSSYKIVVPKFKFFNNSWIAALAMSILGSLFIPLFDIPTFLSLYFLYLAWVFYELRLDEKIKSIFWIVGPFTLFHLLNTLFNTFDWPFKGTMDTLAGFSSIWAVSFAIYQNRQNKKELTRVKQEEEKRQKLEARTNLLDQLVIQRTKEITQQKNALEKSMAELQAAQSQLIQSEKMASLGELTAGIAHEIQNPLNFVNNFSDLNGDLLSEIRAELAKEPALRDDQLILDVLNDIDANSKKINYHGHRASSIVKSMLEHSRKSSAQKEPTDINALCDEYLRLAYHGLRAKEKNQNGEITFQSDFKTDFDATIPPVYTIPQDFGRVVLNLINNAFYAVNEKRKKSLESLDLFEVDTEGNANPSQQINYAPLVLIKTKRIGDNVQIKVIDNGGGIPDAIREKIFQPFFTTKPTGHGTGLGLSLAYDIVTSGHDGTLTVDSDAEETTFTVTIPINAQNEQLKLPLGDKLIKS